MYKLLPVVTWLLFISLANFVFAQDKLEVAARREATEEESKTLVIKSLDGKDQKIRVVPDYVHRILRATCNKYSININQFWGVSPEISVLSKNFIRIDYEVRGGSNLGLGNTIILCVNDGKLYEALHVLRYVQWDSGDLETHYDLKLVLSGNSKRNYKLIADIRDTVLSEPKPQENYIYKNQTVLSFDTVRKAFYSVKENVYNRFITNFSLKGKKQTQPIRGNFPVVILGKETYYLIDNHWYQQGDGNKMDEFQ